MKLKNTLLLTGLAAGSAVLSKKGTEFYNNQYQMMKHVSRLDKNIYLCDYNLSYDLDGLLEKGVSNMGEMLAHVSKTALYGAKLLKIGKSDYACSSFDAVNSKGEHLYGRNFDYKAAPCMVVWTHPDNGYKSVAVADCNFMLYGDKNTPEKKTNRLQTLLAPYCCMDGINEKGLAIGILELKTKATRQDTGKKPISTTIAIRGILDKCATVDEAIDFFKNYDVHDALGCCYHYQITDASGKSAILEYVNNDMRLFYPEKTEEDAHPSQYLTNFFLSKDGDNKKGFGFDRYTRMQSVLGKAKGKLEEAEAMDLLKQVHLNYQHEVYPWRVITLWSAVYNCNAKTLNLCAGLNYNTSYTFRVDEPCNVNP